MMGGTVNPSLFFIFYLLVPYLIGSIPFGLILGKLFGYGDIRKIGSGNIGATNMLRTGNKGLAAFTLFMDGLKGFIAVMLVSCMIPFCRDLEIIAGIAVVLGHIFPVWLRFKGGKGVATTLGVFLAIQPQIFATAIAAWLIVFYFTRYSSLSAIVSLALAPIAAFIFVGWQVAVMALVLAIIVISKHKDNIMRLKAGTETKWSKKA